MNSSVHSATTGVFIDAAKDERTRAALWHGAGELFCAGNDIDDFLKNSHGP
jgi:enoyl-CoA hydratase/carnithine racemase